MSPLLSHIDPDGLLEYSVVFTDRSLNSMSKSFQGVMNDISAALKTAYNADSVVVIPGGGTYGMESIARQFAGVLGGRAPNKLSADLSAPRGVGRMERNLLPRPSRC